MLSSASTADVSQVWPGMDQSFTKEVEDEANSYFQRIYNHPPNPTISIDEVLEMLKKFKDSPVKKERVSKSSKVVVTYLLLTEFEVCTVSYGPRFFPIKGEKTRIRNLQYRPRK